MIPANVKLGDFYLVSFDGKNPNISDPDHWLKNGGAIRIGQWLNGDGFGQYEHAGIYVGNGEVVEASNNGTVLTNWHYDNNDVRWSSGIIQPTSIQRSGIFHAAHGYIGTPYSWPDYAAIATKRLHIHPLDTAMAGYVESTKHMICSQLVARCYLDGGAPLYSYWSGYVTPGDLNNLLDEKSKK